MQSVLQLRINGEDVKVLALVHHTLLEVLREELRLTGTKHGCELGECGMCTVLVDGEPVLSCLALPIDVQGQVITTVEAWQRPVICTPCNKPLSTSEQPSAGTVHQRCS